MVRSEPSLGGPEGPKATTIRFVASRENFYSQQRCGNTILNPQRQCRGSVNTFFLVYYWMAGRVCGFRVGDGAHEAIMVSTVMFSAWMASGVWMARRRGWNATRLHRWRFNIMQKSHFFPRWCLLFQIALNMLISYTVAMVKRTLSGDHGNFRGTWKLWSSHECSCAATCAKSTLQLLLTWR